MPPGILLASYCSLLLVASLVGGWLPARLRLTHTRMQALMSFLGGIMMGVGTLHLLPHAVEHAGSVEVAVKSLLGGLLGMLVLVRCFHFHQHDLPGTPGHSHFHSGDCEHPVATPGPVTTDARVEVPRHDHGDHSLNHDHSGHSHDHDHAGHLHDHDHSGQSHDHDHDDFRTAGESASTAAIPHPPEAGASQNLGWLGLFAGLVAHSLLDGVALGASLCATQHAGDAAALAGLGTFIAVALHKPLDSLSLTSLMSLRGASDSAVRIVNSGYALVCPLGAFVSYLRFGQLSSGESTLLGIALGVSAGIFLCIALVDVVPEIQFHVHDRLKLTSSLLLGVFVAWLIVQFEPEHGHDHSRPGPVAVPVESAGLPG